MKNQIFKQIQEIIETSNVVYRTPNFITDQLFGDPSLIDKTSLISSTNSHQTDMEEIPGYCIRTGRLIKFDLKMPMSEAAFNIWKIQKDEKYPELFCHFSGEESYGKTSFHKPVLYKNWVHVTKLLQNFSFSNLNE